MKSHKKCTAAPALASVALLVHVAHAARSRAARAANHRRRQHERTLRGLRDSDSGSARKRCARQPPWRAWLKACAPQRRVLFWHFRTADQTVSYNSCLDDTVSCINRFHTFSLNLAPKAASDPPGLPFNLTPMLVATTLLSSPIRSSTVRTC